MLTVEKMHGWTHVDTARCEGCSVYNPTTDLVFSNDGRAFCTTCGVPPTPARRVYADVGVASDWVAVGTGRSMPLEHHVRVAALVMLAVTLCFPLAACVSQL